MRFLIMIALLLILSACEPNYTHRWTVTQRDPDTGEVTHEWVGCYGMTVGNAHSTKITFYDSDGYRHIIKGHWSLVIEMPEKETDDE